ncbi:MAG: DUF4149 domain-containing protein [Azonexus sp.]|nr:DUF4149 domain-containing protein [Azonexus sp.]
MRRLTESLYVLLITLWVGGLWAVGYLVAPTLFQQLPDRQLAGVIAGKLFSWMALFGLATGVYLIVFLLVRWGGAALKRAVFWIAGIMLLMAGIQLLGIQPLMAQLKLDALLKDVMESVLRDRFATWHGISSILYLMQSLLGLWLAVGSGRGLR